MRLEMAGVFLITPDNIVMIGMTKAWHPNLRARWLDEKQIINDGIIED